jgi:Outer membrane protein beta-barrel family
MLRFIYLLTTMVVTAVTSLLSAQNVDDRITIKGVVHSEQKLTANTFISLLRTSDQSLVKTELLAENGAFAFENVAKGNYFITVTENGKTKFTGTAFDANNTVEDLTITMDASVNNLQEVVIKKEKPYIERQDGKMILNLENSLSATGSSAFEVLEKAPSVRVDQNDNISLRGKSGVIVQVDGKQIQMSGQNLANYLRGIPSGSVEKIEFITNPSSKYDAAGTAIINIKMKRDKRKGTNGSAQVSYGQGRYPKTNNNLSLNHRNKKINLFGNYSFAYREGFNRLTLDRSFYENGLFDGAYDQRNFLNIAFRNNILRGGLDYFISDKHTLGVLVSGVSNNINLTGENASDVYNQNREKVSLFQTNSLTKERWKNGSLNLNYKYVIDTTGTEFTTDFDYANYSNRNKQDFNTTYYNVDESPADPTYILHGNLRGDLNIFALKSDYVKTFSNKVKFETGLKSSYVKADNALSFYDRSSGIDIFDTTKSNHFIYKENINAAYANASREFGKWNVQLGLRLENTNISGEQLFGGTFFDDSYVQLFPSALVSYNLNPKNSLEINYSRRIQRPSYDQLNPFKFFLDQTTYKAGNPKLEPQTTHSIELTHTFNQKIFTTLSFSRTQNNITETISPSETEERVTVQTTRNLDHVDVYSLAFVVPVKVTKWWDSTNNLNFYVGSYSGTVSNTTLENAGNFTWNCNSQNNFKLGSGFFAELSGNYQAPENYAFDRIRPIWFVNCGLQKKFENKSTLKLAVNDIFNSNEIQATTRFTSYTEHFLVKRDTQTIVLSYTYNFGNGNGAMRRRTGGADDIKQRAGSSNG